MLTISVLFAAIAAVWSYWVTKSDMYMILRWEILALVLVPITLNDMKEQKIPNKMLLIMMVMSVVLLVAEAYLNSAEAFSMWTLSILGFLFIILIFGAARLLSRNGIGGGDIKLFMIIGMLMQLDTTIAILLYTLLSAMAVSLLLMLVKKKKGTDMLPMAPFTLAGVLVAIIFGA